MTDEEIMARLAERFEILDNMTRAVKSGDVNAMIVSGPPGVGLLVAFINMPINQGTCELFRVMFSTAAITVSLMTFFIIALDRYSLYNKHNFKYYGKK